MNIAFVLSNSINSLNVTKVVNQKLGSFTIITTWPFSMLPSTGDLINISDLFEFSGLDYFGDYLVKELGIANESDELYSVMNAFEGAEIDFISWRKCDKDHKFIPIVFLNPGE